MKDEQLQLIITNLLNDLTQEEKKTTSEYQRGYYYGYQTGLLDLVAKLRAIK